MNARVKTVTADQAQNAADGENDWIVVGVINRPILVDGKRKGWIRRTIWDRANKDLPPQPEAAAERNEINEAIKSGRTTTY